MYSQIFVPTRRYHSSSRLEASPFRRRRRKPSKCIYVYVCVCVRALAFFSIPHSKVEFISRPNALSYVRLLRLSLPYSSRFDPLLLLLLLSPFSFRDERLFASPLTPFLSVEIYRPGCRCPLPANRGWRWADSILFLVENCSIVRHWRGMMEWELERGRSVEK